MKNNFLVLIIVGIIAFNFLACQNDVDVIDDCDKITTNSIVGEHSYAFADGLNYTVLEYKLDADATGSFVERSFGNGVKTSTKTFDFLYSLDQYLPHNVGRVLHIDAEEASFDCKWLNGVFYDEQQRAFEASALEENFKKVINDLPNTAWAFRDSTLWVDTIPMDSLHYYSKNVRDTVYDPVTGEPLVNSNGKDSVVIVLKDFVDTVFYDVYDTIGQKTLLDIKLQLNKGTDNLNKGSYIYDYKEFNYDLTVSKDSIVERTFQWGFSSVTSAKKFIVTAVDEVKKDTIHFEISKFDKKKKVLTLDDNELKLQ